ncbi:MAG: hypothetical protein Q4F82_12385 [bacterium]|nr:hypothetical protein [bacterium]
MGAKHNLLKYLEIKNEKKPDFYRKTGLSNGFLDKNEHISSKNLEIIISIYTDLNLYWLITGEGSMYRSPAVMNEAPPPDRDKYIQLLESKIEDQQKIIDLLEEKVDALMAGGNTGGTEIEAAAG